MTAQMSETLLLDGKEFALCSRPLDTYFSITGKKPVFDTTCTALSRGYVGTWEILENRLYLVGISGMRRRALTPISLEEFFPGFPDRVFAHWYTGKIRVPMGKMLKYRHSGFDSTYESELLMDVLKGKVLKTETRVNGVCEDDNQTDGYKIGAMTLL
jgi:hypothetical protein